MTSNLNKIVDLYLLCLFSCMNSISLKGKGRCPSDLKKLIDIIKYYVQIMYDIQNIFSKGYAINGK